MNYVPADDFPEDNFENEDEIIENLEDSDDVLIMDDSADEGGSDEIIEKTDEAEVKAEKATRKPFKKKGVSKTKYNLMFYGSIIITILVIADIAVDLIIGVNPVRALFTGDWSVKKDKGEKETEKPDGGKITPQKPKTTKAEDLKKITEYVIKKYNEVTELRGGVPMSEVPKENNAEVRSLYFEIITWYYRGSKLWYDMNIEGLREKGYDEGDLTHQTDNELTQMMQKNEEIIKELLKDEGLEYMFADKRVRDADREVEMIKNSFLVQYEAKRPRTPLDKLISMGVNFSTMYDKRVDIVKKLNSLYMGMSDVKKDAPEYKEKLTEFEEAGKEYFQYYWSMLVEYYSYLKFAKDNELTPDENIMRLGEKIDGSFEMYEERFKEYTLELDRNTKSAEEMRLKAEELKKEIGDFGKEPEEEDTGNHGSSSSETVTGDGSEKEKDKNESGSTSTDGDKPEEGEKTGSE